MTNHIDRHRGLERAPDDALSSAGGAALLVKLAIEHLLAWENAKREMGLPSAMIGDLTTEDLIDVPSSAAAISEIADQHAISAGVGRYHLDQRQGESSLVEDGLRALLKPISEGA